MKNFEKQERLFESLLNKKLSTAANTPNDSVWSHIEHQLNNQFKRRGIILFLHTAPSWIKYAVAATIGLSIGIGVSFFSDFSTTSKKSNELADRSKLFQLKRITNKRHTFEAIHNNTTTASIESTEPPTDIASSNEHVLYANTSGDAADNNHATPASYFVFNEEEDKLVLDMLAMYGSDRMEDPEDIQTYTLSLIESNDISYEEIVSGNTDASSFPRFQSNASYGYKGFWAGPSISYMSLINADFHLPGTSLGIDVGYDFTTKWGMQTGLYYQIHQRSPVLIHPDRPIFRPMVTNVNSVLIPALVKYKMTRLSERTNKAVSLNLYAGPAYSVIHSPNIQQLGAMAGVEYDLFVNGNMMATFGVRANWMHHVGQSFHEDVYWSSQSNTYLGAYASFRIVHNKKKK